MAKKATSRKVIPIFGPPDGAAAVVDEFSRLEEWKLMVKPSADRYEQLRKEILSWYKDAPPEKAFVVAGATHVVEITAKRRDRKITEMAKLARRLGAKILYELCSVPMKAVDELIPKGEQDAYVTEGHIGPRYITTTRKAAAEMAADKSSA